MMELFNDLVLLKMQQEVNTVWYTCQLVCLSFIVHWLRTVDILHGDSKQQVNAAGVKDTNCSSGSENIGLVVQHPMLSLSGKATWIIDCGATSHMCNDQSLFVEYESLKTPLKVTLGDGYEVDAIGCGVVMPNSVLPSGESKRSNLQNILTEFCTCPGCHSICRHQLAKEKLVNGCDYASSGEISFCQACVEEKLHKNQIPTIGGGIMDL